MTYQSETQLEKNMYQDEFVIFIKDAINDGNVLGFSVEYHRTFDSKIVEEDDTCVEAINTD